MKKMMHLPLHILIQAVTDCNLTFVKPETSVKTGLKVTGSTVCCSYCHTYQIPLEFHIGDVFSSDPTHLKPVVEWDMQKAEPTAALRNAYKTGQVLREVKDGSSFSLR